MAALDEWVEGTPLKTLLLGDSGCGKTGALAALAKAGFKLRIADFDKGLDILYQLLRNDPEARANVDFMSFTDQMKGVNGKVIPKGAPSAAPKFLAALDKWDDGSSIYQWGQETVFCLDSMTFYGLACLRHKLAEVGRLLEAPWQSDWGDAMKILEDTLALLYADAVKCHVIVTSHIAYLEREGEPVAGFPTALGQKLPPKVPRYFNTVFRARSKTVGTKTSRVLVTQAEPLVGLKCPNTNIPRELPLETGLATFFEKMGYKP